MNDLHWVELIIFTALFLGVTVMGFLAARWKSGATMDHLDEWGLGGRKFGSWITWFLIGGDLYTAYTFVAVPALLFSAGALGFYALPYTIIAFPLALLPLVRMWSVSRVRGYVTPADFVRGRYDSPLLALLIALTGLLATMPYIALQLVGLEAVLRTMGLNGGGFLGHLPLLIAFVILAVYTYQSGLRAPALIAFVKDSLIYIVVIIAVIYLPIQLGGWGSIFESAGAALAEPGPTGDARGSLLLGPNNQLQYATLALGSALALFLYPHALTGVLAAKSGKVVRRNMVALPAYSLMLGLLLLLGYAAVATGAQPEMNAATGRPDANTVIPVLFSEQFPSWFTGLAFAAIGIGALVPAAIMSIAAANLWTRNVYKEYLRRDATPAQETRQAKLASLVVKFGALGFIVFVDPQFSIDLQLIGGVIILQTLPAVAIALYTRWFHRWALIAGWATGMIWGFLMLYSIPNPVSGREHFGGSALQLGELSVFGWYPFAGSEVQIFVGFVALAANLLVATLVTLVCNRFKVPVGSDHTEPADYLAEEAKGATGSTASQRLPASE
ncbi:monocarboxylate uptake permease MctP [Actinoalloteichus hymeniacidonis]|uniref:Na+/proline symporter n=1 Tax=Actinoalloteichus hymeniacidonis TaxID=340345 RepID=A0AAC9N1E7_9PSEU|nr:sodium:solute symporter [Actinoalloteichus hymeniacidonis]AOS66107.1 Na+/proline symporter [Actinoalloteichus hymeniacidonis]MBB5905789.1 SSS family solute:Na+ symporter [Actinoalloteichus hymeniacidonis]